MQKPVNKILTEMPMCRTWQSAKKTIVILAGTLLFSVPADGLVQGSINEVGLASGNTLIEGFRSARFGMTQSETISAIRLDFQLERENIKTQRNEVDGTSSLIVTVEEIFSTSKPARVAYIHGYKENKLIQINVLWGSPLTENIDPQALVTTANILRKYFLELGFAPENTVSNTRVNDRVFLVFRASDEMGRMVLLQLISKIENIEEREEGEGQKIDPSMRVETLLLSYIENIKDPDIFRLQKGDF